MNADLSELYRLLQNLIRFGVIVEVKGDKARVRLGPKLTTDWLKWATLRAGSTRTWWCPSIGEQVIVLSPGGDLTRGKILPAIYSDAFPAPDTNPDVHTTHYPDGAVIQYDCSTHALTATLPGGTATVKADEVTSDAPKTLCTGDLTVAKNLIVNGSSALNGGVNAKAGENGGIAMQVEGVMKASVDVVAGDVSLSKHPHGGVQRGDDKTEGPSS